MTPPPSPPPTQALARILPGPMVPMGSHKVPIARHELDRQCHTLLFTRYFMRGAAAANRPEPDAAQIRTWFDSREPLFLSYTLPSVLGQLQGSFTWYILVDEPFADWVPIDIRSPTDPRIRLVTSDVDGQPIASLTNFVSSAIDQQFKRMRADGVANPVVTVARLDNDDAIACDFVDLLSRLALIAQRDGQQRDVIVSFPHGLQYLREREFSTYLFNNNHFLASLHPSPAPAGRRIHAHSFNHSYAFAKAPHIVLANTDLPMWIEVVHGKNLINKYRPVAPRRGNEGIEARFCSSYPVDKGTTLVSAAPHLISQHRPVAPRRGDEGIETRFCALNNPIDKGTPLVNATSPVAPAAGETPTFVTAAGSAIMARQQLARAIRDCIAASGAMKPPVFATVYESVLSSVPVERLFEIGIHRGGSIRMWRQLLGSGACIACLDIKAEACDTARDIANHVYAGSQTDSRLLKRIADEAGPFDIIIDDGSHQNPHMIFSFEALFEHVRPGGAYIIEDMFTSYWPRYRGGLRKPGSLIEYAKDLVDRLYAPFISEKYKAHYVKEVLPKFEHSKVSAHIASIEFFAAGIIVVHRRAAV